MDRQDDDSDLGMLLGYLVQDLKTATVRHGDIEEHEVGFELSDELESFATLAGFAYYNHALDFFHKCSNTRAHQRVVVSDYGRGTTKRDLLATLSPRQREVLRLIAEGRTTKQIAQVLEISVKTVETHRAQLMERLGIHDVAGLVRYAIIVGLIEVE